jgi:hypothetical protein
MADMKKKSFWKKIILSFCMKKLYAEPPFLYIRRRFWEKQNAHLLVKIGTRCREWRYTRA